MSMLREIARRVPLARKTVQDLKWRKLRDNLESEGIRLGNSPRVEEFVRTRFGISDAEYLHSLQKPKGFIRSLESRRCHVF